MDVMSWWLKLGQGGVPVEVPAGGVWAALSLSLYSQGFSMWSLHVGWFGLPLIMVASGQSKFLHGSSGLQCLCSTKEAETASPLPI